MKRSASIISAYQKSNLFLWQGAVAFLMFMFLCCLHNIDHCNDDTDNRHYNTTYTDYCFQHHFVPFTLFSIGITSKIPEVLRMYSIWRKANRYRFR